jgi:serine/threonine-protein phosphatase 2A activator
MSELQPEFTKLDMSDNPAASPPLSKRILTKAHLETFQASTTHQEIVELVEDLNRSIVGIKLGQDGEKSAVSPVTPLPVEATRPAELELHRSQSVKSILAMLDEVEETAKSIPPVDNSASRFGNPAFKTFYDRVQEVSRRLAADMTASLLNPSNICLLAISRSTCQVPVLRARRCQT